MMARWVFVSSLCRSDVLYEVPCLYKQSKTIPYSASFFSSAGVSSGFAANTYACALRNVEPSTKLCLCSLYSTMVVGSRPRISRSLSLSLLLTTTTTQLWRRTCSRCSTQRSCPPSCGEPSSHPPRSDPQRPRQSQRRPTRQQRVHLSYQILPQLSENTRGSLHLQNPAAAVGEGLLFRNIPSRPLPRREQADL